MNQHKKKVRHFFEKFSLHATKWAGSTIAFFTAAGLIITWLATGPIFQFSNTWQLVINTATTIITFLMVFLIQKTQNKDGLAIQLKLNELVAAEPKASNRLVNVEDMTEEELDILHAHYAKLAELTKKEKDLRTSHSIEEAQGKHKAKIGKTEKGN
jgi:low affinity Fe/Cu permease